MATRKKPIQEVETEILVRSRRRCALCFGLRGDLEEKRGQMAHVDRNPTNSAVENLCYLCLEHHDLYDSGHSQSKGFTPAELRHYREALYTHIEEFGIRPAGRALERPPEVVFLTLHGNSFDGVLHLELKNDATAFTILKFEAATPGASIKQWHPRSLSPGDLLRAPTLLPNRQIGECIYHMKIRDRAGNERVFQILVDLRQSPSLYDFVEVGETAVPPN